MATESRHLDYGRPDPKSTMRKQRAIAATLILVGSLVLTPFAFYLAFYKVNPEGSPTVLALFFPYTLLGLRHGEVPVVLVVLALVQIPVYGLFLAVGLWMRRFAIVLGVLVAIHVAAMLLCWMQLG